MIYVSHQLPVNVPGEPHLDRAAVWDGLVLKANNALPFVPSMTYCEVTARHGATVFDRDIDFRGQRVRVAVAHRDVGTERSERQRGGLADALRGAGDDGDPPVQPAGHRGDPLRSAASRRMALSVAATALR